VFDKVVAAMVRHKPDVIMVNSSDETTALMKGRAEHSERLPAEGLSAGTEPGARTDDVGRRDLLAHPTRFERVTFAFGAR